MHARGRLLALVRDGETVSGAARTLGIPRATVYSWKARDQRFSQELGTAVAANRASRAVTPAPNDWRASAAWLEAAHPERWAASLPAPWEI